MAMRIGRLMVLIPLTVPTVLMLGLLVAPTTSAGDPCYQGYAIPPRTDAAETQIKVAPCAFAPTVARVAVGATVSIFNGPEFTHLVTGANAEWGSRDVELKPGETVSYRFDKPGIYPYACALHSGMSGAIVVGDGGGGLAAPASDASGPGAEEGASGSATGPDGATVAAGTGAGVVAGAAALWLVTRRRRQTT